MWQILRAFFRKFSKLSHSEISLIQLTKLQPAIQQLTFWPTMYMGPFHLREPPLTGGEGVVCVSSADQRE